MIVNSYRYAGAAARALLGKLWAWYDFESNLNDGWGCFPLVDVRSSENYGAASTYGSGPSGNAVISGRVFSRSTLKPFSGTTFGIGALVSTSAFSAGDFGSFCGDASGANLEALAIRESASGYEAHARNSGTDYDANAASSANAWHVVVAEHDASGTISLHKDTSLAVATNAGSVALNNTKNIGIGQFSADISMALASQFIYEGALTQDELNYLNTYPSLAQVISDAGYVQPAVNPFDLSAAPTGYISDYQRKRLACLDVSVSAAASVRGSVVRSSGKRWYCIKVIRTINDGTNDIQLGSANLTTTSYNGILMTKSGGLMLTKNGVADAAYSGIARCDNGDVLMVAEDISAKKIWYGRNGTWDGDPAAGTGNAASYTTTESRQHFFYFPKESSCIELIQTAADMPYTSPSGYTPWGD